MVILLGLVEYVCLCSALCFFIGVLFNCFLLSFVCDGVSPVANCRGRHRRCCDVVVLFVAVVVVIQVTVVVGVVLASCVFRCFEPHLLFLFRCDIVLRLVVASVSGIAIFAQSSLLALTVLA